MSGLCHRVAEAGRVFWQRMNDGSPSGRFCGRASTLRVGASPGDLRNDAQRRARLEVNRHEVSQRGAVGRADDERGQRPISTMQPPQTGHRSMR